MHVIGLTGGIGSGKSTVAARFAQRGAIVIDADRIAREVVEPGRPALAEIAAAFGDDVIDADGHLDRPAMAAIVFADPAARQQLEAITHPRIRDEIARRLAEIAATEQDDRVERVVVLDHPLLVESGLAGSLETVVVVHAPVEVRVRRLVATRGMDEDDARARLTAQADDETRKAAATHLVDNTGPLDALDDQVEAILADVNGQP